MNANNQELNCPYQRSTSQSMQVNYSHLSPSSSSSSYSANSLSISPEHLQNMMINTNQLYLTASTGSSSSPSSASSSASMSPLQDKVKNESHQYSQYGSNTSDQYLDMSMSEDMDSSNVNESSSQITGKLSSNNKVNRFFADGVVDILNKWFVENQNYPYPDENMTNILAKEANISAKQVRKWFANKRVRSNKCVKQSVNKVKKDSKSRRQTKSVSEVDQLPFNMTDSDEFNVTNVEHMNTDDTETAIRRNKCSASKKIHKRASYCLNSSSVDSTSPSFIESSPIYSNDQSKLFNNCNYDYYEENRNKKQIEQQELIDSLNNASFKYQQQHQQQQLLFLQQQQTQQIDQNITNASLLCNNLINSTDQTKTLAMAAALNLYGPIFVLNLLQNPTMAIQTAIATQLINNNNLNNNNNLSNINHLNSSVNTHKNTAEEKLAFKSAYNKRKTHLSHCFYRETSENITSELSIDLTSSSKPIHNETSFDQTKCSNSSSSSSVDSEEFNTTPNSASSCSTSYSSPLIMFDSYTFPQNNMPIKTESTAVKPTRKINFGDISDLIN